MTLDIVTVVLLVAAAFCAGVLVSYQVCTLHFMRETSRLVEDAYRLRG